MKTTTGLAISSLTLVLVASIGIAHADIPEQVPKKLAGEIVITSRPLSEIHLNSANPMAAIEKVRVSELAHQEKDELATWSFHFTAFLKKAPGMTMLSMDFYTDDKARLYVANKRFGIKPDMQAVSGEITITEDDGLIPGRRYLVKLTGKRKGREVVLAQTKLTTR